ncbi:MAG: tRNA guanosine(34) transglycosylase Tgt [Acidobacteria bacterium 13_1_40CM_2_68_5]|nr:MAG: tRNA guanosine(34) transglycosylase Tgt [Acidobacteria bacterium 13_1_40CM_2_68_5]
MSGAFSFGILSIDPGSAARRGRITTPHGTIETPAFMPVGTAGTVKGMTPEDLESLGFEIVLGNTYHLALRPGEEVVRRLGGLHRFMGWERAILTDSGGFQVLSLADLRTITDEGVSFRSHLDGSLLSMTPERSMQIQTSLGSDIVMAFDDCPALPSPRPRILEAVRRTSLWARRSREALLGPGQALFGIVQGGDDPALREQSAEEITALGFDGYAIGGVSVGESADLSRAVVALTAPRLPPDRPRYLMGMGTPADLVEMVALGCDLFDCVLPTRNARNGTLFTSTGRLSIKRSEFAADPRPVDGECSCPVCRRFSRAYLRHLYVAGEILSMRLNTLHNLHQYADLMRRARAAIEAGRYAEFLSERRARWTDRRREAETARPADGRQDCGGGDRMI